MAFAWQTLEEAAVTLGVSGRTLHRRVARGEVQTRMENGRREVLVTVADPDTPLPSATPSATSASASVASDNHSAASHDPSATSDPSSDMPPPSSATSSASSATSSHVSDRQSDMSAGRFTPFLEPTFVTAKQSVNRDSASDGHETALALAEDRLRRADLALSAFQQTLTFAAAEARRARTGALVAWSTLGTLVILAIICAVWATHRVTAASAEVSLAKRDIEHLSDELQSMSATADTVRQQADDIRAEADKLRQQVADSDVATAEAEGRLIGLEAMLRQLTEQQQRLSATTQPSVTPTHTPTNTPASPPATQPLSALDDVKKLFQW